VPAVPKRCVSQGNDTFIWLQVSTVYLVLASSGNHKYLMGLAGMARNLEGGLSTIWFCQFCKADTGGREKFIQNLAAKKKLNRKPRHRLKDNVACRTVAMQRP
jgi:hypothetical protein